MARLFLLLVWLSPMHALAQLDAPPEPPLPAKPNEPPPAERQWSVSPAPQPSQSVTVPAPALPPPPPPISRYQSLVRSHRPSPQWTQDRSFTSTRFWLMDPGNYEVQAWARTRVFDGAPTELRLQQEIEIGLVPHLQIDIYENLTNLDSNGRPNWSQEGVQLEARIAIPSYYGQMFANPVVYLEFHPRHNAPDRAEVRLLLGGAATHWLYLAVNPYVELNVEPTDTAMAVTANGMPTVTTSSRFIADMEFGTTIAAGFRITDWFRLSAETKIGADMLGDPNNQLHFVWFLGPGFILKPLPARFRNYLKVMGTYLLAMPGTAAGAQRFEPLFIVGSQF